jgi:hypothetical protein
MGFIFAVSICCANEVTENINTKAQVFNNNNFILKNFGCKGNALELNF